MTSLRNRMTRRNRIKADEQIWRKNDAAWQPKADAPETRKPAGPDMLTDALDAARERRLLALLRGHFPGRRTLETWEQAMQDGKHTDNYYLLSLCACVLIVRRTDAAPRVSWEEFKQVLETKQGRPEAFRLLTRAGRAMHLLDRALAVGCVKRGEVERAEVGQAR